MEVSLLDNALVAQRIERGSSKACVRGSIPFRGAQWTIAQSAERRAVNSDVPGSSPGGPAGMIPTYI